MFSLGFSSTPHSHCRARCSRPGWGGVVRYVELCCCQNESCKFAMSRKTTIFDFEDRREDHRHGPIKTLPGQTRHSPRKKTPPPHSTWSKKPPPTPGQDCPLPPVGIFIFYSRLLSSNKNNLPPARTKPALAKKKFLLPPATESRQLP